MQPLLYAALAAAAGIGAAAAGGHASAWLWAPLLAAWIYLLTRPRRRLTGMVGLAFCVTFFNMRAASVLHQPAPESGLAHAATTLQPSPRDRIFVIGYVRDTPALLYDAGQPSGVRLDLETIAVGRSAATGVEPVSGGLRLTSPAPQRGLLALEAGDGLAVTVHLRPVAEYHDPGVADFAAAARRQGIAMTATLAPGTWQHWPIHHPAALPRLRAHIWRWLSTGVDRLTPPAREPQVNALLRGMLLGDVARLDEATRANFQADGTYHLLVVAGLHIGVLAALLWWGFRRLRLPSPWAAGATLALLGAYAWIIAGRTPTLRALLMLTVYFGARLWHRDRQALNAVGAAALLLLAVHPLDLFAAGFQMSLGAALLLAGVALPLMARTSHLWRQAHRTWSWRIALAVYDIVLISLLLQIGMAAFNIVYFHRANPWSVLANAVLVPAASLLIPLAWVALAATALMPACGTVAAAAVGGLGRLTLAIAAAMARWPGAQGRVPSPPDWFLVAFAALTGAWLAAMIVSSRWRTWALAAGACTAAALVMAASPFAPRLPPGLSATILDVGQGDSILVTFPDHRTLLVDGGPRSAHWDSGEQIVAPFLWSLGLRHIDAVLLTHAHMDHLGGLSTVVANFHPATVWMTRTLPQEPPMLAFLRVVAASRARVRRLSAGDIFLAGASRIQVLLPPPDYVGGEVASNDDSMVVRVSWGQDPRDAMLLDGDAQTPGETWMVQHDLPLASALLKVGHHGSKTSSSPLFVQSVAPSVAVISVGAGNSYGHPAPEVIARLQQEGARVFRTDRDGAVQCRLAGPPGQPWLRVFLFPRLPGT